VDVIVTFPINHKMTRLPVIWGLVVSFLLIGCLEKKDDQLVAIEWEGRHPRGITIPLKMLPGIAHDSVGQLVHIQLATTKTPILGEYSVQEDALLFRPVIAFTRGLKYEVRVSDKLISEIEIPLDSTLTVPEVGCIFPTSDTVPLNLLKIYILFSKPMQEGQSLDKVAVIRNRQDTIPSVFLDLQPELWNKERTILTLWLDPGRIKRDLQPNKAMGSPLQQGASYQILVRKDWRDVEGVALANDYRQNFVVGLRDGISPSTESWTIHAPKPATTQPVKIELKESLDYVLLKNAVRIVDNKGTVINGDIEIGTEEKALIFIPSVAWNAGEYWVEVEARLEDLAGNNLERLFDKDLSKPGKGEQKEVYKRSFHVQ
jgi:hypothetical protein